MHIFTNHRSTVFILIFVLFSLGSSAQMHYATDDTVSINEVIVTGSHVQVKRSNVPVAVSVIKREQIEESNESALLPVLNGRVPGLFVTERGTTGFGVAKGSAGQISIRGMGGNPTSRVLMLIDGHPQFMGIMGHPLPDSYVASDVERVEVIRGPASVLYGSNAMGGVINIITKKQNRQGVHGNARVSYGSYNTQKYSAAVGWKQDKFSVFISGNRDRTDGHRPHSEFEINNGYVKLNYDISDHFSLSSDLSLAKFNAADPGPDTLNSKVGEKIDIDRGYYSFSLKNRFEKVSGAIKWFHNFGEHEITDGFHSTDHNYGFNLHQAIHFNEKSTTTVGLDFMNYGGKAENEKAKKGQGIVFADTTLNEWGAYLLQQQQLGNLTLNAGIRYQHHSKFGDIWIPTFGAAYKLSEESSLNASASKGFRSPTMRELFMWNPNPSLNPEEVWSYEMGYKQAFLGRRLLVEMSIYRISGDNLIVNAGPKGYKNSGKVANNGLELAVTAEPTKHLNLRATYSFISMDEPVYATPKHHLYIHAGYRLKKWSFMTDVQQIVDLDNDPSPVENLESYLTVNAKTVYRWNKQLKLTLSVDNLFDTAYETNRYYTMPGTTATAGLAFTF